MRSRESVRRAPVALYRVCLRCREEEPETYPASGGVFAHAGGCGGLVVRQPRRNVARSGHAAQREHVR